MGSSCDSNNDRTNNSTHFPTVQISASANDSSDLILNINVYPISQAIGYANVYSCRINRVMKGRLKDTVVSITILANKNNYSIDSLIGIGIMNDQPVEMGFKKHGINEKYNKIPINGFVDGNKTSWEIKYIKLLEDTQGKYFNENDIILEQNNIQNFFNQYGFDITVSHSENVNPYRIFLHEFNASEQQIEQIKNILKTDSVSQQDFYKIHMAEYFVSS
jgi:hypothetical protein